MKIKFNNKEPTAMQAMRKYGGLNHFSFYVDGNTFKKNESELLILTNTNELKIGDLIQFQDKWFEVRHINFENHQNIKEVLCILFS